MGLPVEVHIRGIACDTPNHQGNKIYYNIATSQKLAGRSFTINTALANSQKPGIVGEKMQSSGWWVYTAVQAAGNDRKTQELFDLLLKGAGIMGLLVGGIGVANTMQVLLRRRQHEVAVLKACGYRTGQTQTLFAIEAGLLGLFGSLLGAGLGLAVSRSLLRVFEATGNLLIDWSFSPLPVITGILVGAFTTVIFALWAIVSTSQVQPMALFRNEAVQASQLHWIKGAGLAALLSLPFTAITSLVMGSVLKGIGVLLFALIGLAMLGGLFAFLIWLVARLLPLQSLPLAFMALRRGRFMPVFAMIALFIGIVTMSMGIVVTQGAQNTMLEQSIQVDRYNLRLIAPAEQEGMIRKLISEQDINSFAYGYQASVQSISLVGSKERSSPDPILIGRSEPGEYQIQGADWGSQAEGGYVYEGNQMPSGSQVQIKFWDGRAVTVPVVGTYSVEMSAASLPPQTGLLMTNDLAVKLSQPDIVTFYLQAPESRAETISSALGKALPSATVIDLQAYAARFSEVYHNLFVLAVSMASLALLAGMLLIANSASLAMLDRRYELGVLKAVGYSRQHIFTNLAVEYSLIALIATAAGLAVVQIFFTLLAIINQMAASLLVLSLPSALLIGLLGMSLTLLAGLGATWRPALDSPAAVLNERV